ncbi:MAG: hypothetical protein QOC77_3387 [Thermoleophilaceae bacterium]|nr:hypothetical protein [Thermoleophilaceae bacterium]
MLARIRSRLTYANVMASVAVFLALGGGAYAATSFVGADGRVRGCVSKKGQLTVLKPGKKCAKGLTAITWNQKGPTGAQGLTGDHGDPGPSTGPAGGALAGSYPNPTLNVSGGPCVTGQFLTNLSNLSALTCGPLGSITALGQDALSSNTSGYYNSALGQGALKLNTTGATNSAFGAFALAANTTSCCNSAVGGGALLANTDGGHNSALGGNALAANTHGEQNSAVGYDALNDNTIGVGDSAVGALALQGNTGGDYNSAVGHAALANTGEGSNNSALGWSALGQTTGLDNSAVGALAMGSVTTGNANIALGYQAGQNLTTGDNNIDIGNQGVAGESRTIRIGTQGTGQGQQDKAFLAGVNGARVDQNAPVLVGSDGKLGTVVSSSRRFKTDIRPLGTMNRLIRLRPVSYRYKPRWAGGDRRVRYGLIAEEVIKVFPALVQRGPNGKPEGVRYGDLPVLLLATVKHQQHQIDRLTAQVHALARRR